MTLAGLPPTRVIGATSRVTTLPAATTAPRPTVTPLSTMALAPIQTSSSSTIGSLTGLCRPRSATETPWPSLSSSITFAAIRQLRPMRTRFVAWMEAPLMRVPSPTSISACGDASTISRVGWYIAVW